MAVVQVHPVHPQIEPAVALAVALGDGHEVSHKVPRVLVAHLEEPVPREPLGALTARGVLEAEPLRQQGLLQAGELVEHHPQPLRSVHRAPVERHRRLHALRGEHEPPHHRRHVVARHGDVHRGADVPHAVLVVNARARPHPRGLLTPGLVGEETLDVLLRGRARPRDVPPQVLDVVEGELAELWHHPLPLGRGAPPVGHLRLAVVAHVAPRGVLPLLLCYLRKLRGCEAPPLQPQVEDVVPRGVLWVEGVLQPHPPQEGLPVRLQEVASGEVLHVDRPRE
mmetsp:Transcript_16262/g.51094  ORF Transcript_16262/g.51094 Transcript_16262/m.51094 type:complete len:281 (+) Transcript_16262:459-1301(+)